MTADFHAEKRKEVSIGEGLERREVTKTSEISIRGDYTPEQVAQLFGQWQVGPPKIVVVNGDAESFQLTEAMAGSNMMPAGGLQPAVHANYTGDGSYIVPIAIDPGSGVPYRFDVLTKGVSAHNARTNVFGLVNDAMAGGKLIAGEAQATAIAHADFSWKPDKIKKYNVRVKVTPLGRPDTELLLCVSGLDENVAREKAQREMKNALGHGGFTIERVVLTHRIEEIA